MKKYFIIIGLLLYLSVFSVFCNSNQASNVLISEGNGNSNPHEFIKYKDKVYFSAYNPQYGPELWMTDGTSEGTVLLKDLTPGGELNSGISTNLAIVNDTLFFETVKDIWKSDGTPEGTVKVKTFEGYNLLRHYDLQEDDRLGKFYASAGGLYYFVVSNFNLSYPFKELWKSNGYSEGTVAVTDSFQYMDNLLEFNDKLFFVGSKTSYSNNIGIWVSDGTDSGTKCIMTDISDHETNYNPCFTVYNNKLFFTAYNGSGVIGLYYTDGTVDGTVLVKNNMGYDYDGFTELNGNLYFTVDSSNTSLWKTDGTTDGTVKIKEIYSSNCGNCEYNLTRVGNRLYFNDYEENKLWISDGTTDGTYILKSVVSDNNPGDWDNFTEFKGKLYFSTEIFNHNLCVSDGTEEGTKAISQIVVTGVQGRFYPKIFVYGDYMLISAYDSIHGNELWKSDGTTEGTILLKDIYASDISRINISEINPEIALYPNPATDEVNIRINYNGLVEIDILNFLGQKMYTWRGEVNNNDVKRISLESYKTGFYLVWARYGYKEGFAKFVKQ